MKLFRPLYEFALRWASRPRAEWYLIGLSFVEAFIFPVAPEIMLAPMTLSKPQRWARYAGVSLVGSLVGSFVGYALGHYAFQLAKPLFEDLGWMPRLNELVDNLHDQSPWKVFLLLVAAGFVPIPLKIFTWASGLVGVPLVAFVGGMLVGRGKRVFAVSGVIRLGGERAEAVLHRWIEWIGWALLGLIALVIVYFKFLHGRT